MASLRPCRVSSSTVPLTFGFYDTAKGMLPPNLSRNILVSWMFAQTITTGSGIISYPFDTVRRRHDDAVRLQGRRDHVQGNLSTAGGRSHNKKAPGLFFKGAFTNILRGTGGTLVLVLYDELKTLIRSYHGN